MTPTLWSVSRQRWFAGTTAWSSMIATWWFTGGDRVVVHDGGDRVVVHDGNRVVVHDGDRVVHVHHHHGGTRVVDGGKTTVVDAGKTTVVEDGTKVVDSGTELADEGRPVSPRTPARRLRMTPMRIWVPGWPGPGPGPGVDVATAGPGPGPAAAAGDAPAADKVAMDNAQAAGPAPADADNAPLPGMGPGPGPALVLVMRPVRVLALVLLTRLVPVLVRPTRLLPVPALARRMHLARARVLALVRPIHLLRPWCGGYTCSRSGSWVLARPTRPLRARSWSCPRRCSRSWSGSCPWPWTGSCSWTGSWPWTGPGPGGGGGPDGVNLGPNYQKPGAELWTALSESGAAVADSQFPPPGDQLLQPRDPLLRSSIPAVLLQQLSRLPGRAGRRWAGRAGWAGQQRVGQDGAVAGFRSTAQDPGHGALYFLRRGRRPGPGLPSGRQRPRAGHGQSALHGYRPGPAPYARPGLCLASRRRR